MLTFTVLSRDDPPTTRHRELLKDHAVKRNRSGAIQDGRALRDREKAGGGWPVSLRPRPRVDPFAAKLLAHVNLVGIEVDDIPRQRVQLARSQRRPTRHLQVGGELELTRFGRSRGGYAACSSPCW